MKVKLHMYVCALFIEMHNYVTGPTEMDQVSMYIKFHHIFQLCCIKTNHLFKLKFLPLMNDFIDNILQLPQ